jgi:Zn-dependent protease with chaperone function
LTISRLLLEEVIPESKRYRDLNLWDKATTGVIVTTVISSVLAMFRLRQVPVTGRWQIVPKRWLANSDLVECTSIFDRFRTENETRGFLIDQGAAYDRVAGVMTRLLQVASPDALECQFEVAIRNKPLQPNMHCLPGGKIVIDTGILDKLESDDELALLLGHEIGHAVAMHGLEKSFRHLLNGPSLIHPDVIFGIPLTPLAGVFHYTAQLGVKRFYTELGYSRKQELEADRIGLTYMLLAGYDAGKATFVWIRLKRYLTTVWEPKSTHPNPDKRLRLLQQWLDQGGAR